MQGSWSHEYLLQSHDSLHLFPGNQSALSLFLVCGVKNAKRSATLIWAVSVCLTPNEVSFSRKSPNHKTKGRRGRKKLPFQNEILRVKVESLDWKWLSHDSDMRISQFLVMYDRRNGRSDKMHSRHDFGEGYAKGYGVVSFTFHATWGIFFVFGKFRKFGEFLLSIGEGILPLVTFPRRFNHSVPFLSFVLRRSHKTKRERGRRADSLKLDAAAAVFFNS